jgi:hypothetical protein
MAVSSLKGAAITAVGAVEIVKMLMQALIKIFRAPIAVWLYTNGYKAIRDVLSAVRGQVRISPLLDG